MLRPDVRSGSEADITNGPSNVRFTRESRPLSSVVPGLTVTSTDNSRDFSLTRTIVQPPCLLVAKSAVTFSLRGIVWPDRLRRQFRHHRRIALPKRRCRFRELRYVEFRWSSHRNKGRRFSEWRVDFNAPSANRWGWTVGVGTEWALAENWSVVGKWDYLNFGTQTLTFTDPSLGSTQVGVKQHINELKLGINYRFGNRLP